MTSSEGSPSVPQHPVERWTICVCPEHGRTWNDEYFCTRAIRRGKVIQSCCKEATEVEVVPALVASRLAEALRGINAYFTSGSPDEDDVIAISAMAADALEVYESGGATKPGEES